MQFYSVKRDIKLADFIERFTDVNYRSTLYYRKSESQNGLIHKPVPLNWKPFYCVAAEEEYSL